MAVAGFAFFPEYVGLLVGVESAPISVASSSSKVRAFAIEGMTCEGCAGGIRAKIQEVPGVQTVSVSFKDKSASVSFVGEPKDDEVLAAIASAGYEGHVVF